MRKILLLAFTLFSAALFAQAPQGINYQAVARNVSGAEMPNTPVSVRIEILDAGLVAVYQEDHSTTTNAFGLFNVVIGQGTNPTSTFSNIDWANGPFYLRVNIDANGSGYVNMGYTQLWSVPYALYAKESANGPQGLPGVNCWDLDGDGVNDPAEDVNSDSQWNTLDCQGATGATGATGAAGATGPTGLAGANGINGTNCWDANNDGVQDAAEDINSDGFWNALDCIGATGATGVAGANGTNGTNCWDLDNDGVQDLSEDINTDGFWNALDCQGATGPVGPTGTTGLQGPTGAQGIQGLQGPTGPQGVQGLQGATGSQGLQGVQGPTGAAGAQGATGPTGTFSMAGTFGQTLYYNTAWTATSNLYNDGTNVGIGSISPQGRLHVDLSTTASNVNGTVSNLSTSGAGNNAGLNASVNGSGTGNYYGVYGQGNNASGSGAVYGVWSVGYGMGTGLRYGVYGAASIQATGQTGYGVYASAASGGNSGTKYALYADATGTGTNYAGWFEGGNVYIKNNVGIGTANPGAQLQVADISTTTGASVISILGGTAGTASLSFGSTTNSNFGLIRYEMPTNRMLFWTNNTQRMTLDASGNLGIGFNFTTPQSLLHIHSTGVTQAQMTNPNTGSGSGDGFIYGVDNSSTVFLTNQEGGGFKFKDGANSPLWISGVSVGVNSPTAPLNAFTVHNNVSHLSVQVSGTAITLGDVNNVAMGNYLYIDHESAAAKFMFWGANTSFGMTVNPTARVHVQGGSSSATTYSMKVQNGTGGVQFATRDDGQTGIGTTATSPSSTLDVSGSFALSGQAVAATASTTISVTADQSVVFVSANNVTVTLPAASSCKGRMIWVKQTNTFTTTTIATAGGNVEGSGTYSIGSSGSRRAAMFMSDGTGWWLMSIIP